MLGGEQREGHVYTRVLALPRGETASRHIYSCVLAFPHGETLSRRPGEGK